jgi:hypothetical protein
MIISSNGGGGYSGRSAIEKVLTAIEAATHQVPLKTANGWQTCCPAHDDSKPSLAVSESSDGSVLLKCHAGCTASDVVAAIGLSLADLFLPSTSTHFTTSPGKAKYRRRNGATRTDKPAHSPHRSFPVLTDAVAELDRRHGAHSAAWTYEDAFGDPVGVIVRWDRAGGSKDIRPASRHGDSWRLEGMAKPYPLYRLPELGAAKRVYVCEGEKAADSARGLGLIATTSPHGASSAASADWSPLAGKDVVLLPDNDHAGRKYAATVEACLAKQLPPATVRTISLPGLAEKQDIVDWIAASADATPSLLRAELESLVASTETSAPPPPATTPETFRPFPLEALPEPLRSFVAAASKSIGCEASFVALPALAVCAAAIGTSRKLQLRSDWTEPAILWVAIVGESGTQKSPAFAKAMAPLKQRQRLALEQHAELLADYEAERMDYERRLAVWKRDNKADLPPVAPTAPSAERCLVSDTTVEALAPLLRDNQRGVLLGRDELNGWLGSFDRYAKGGKGGGDSSHWLSMFNGEQIIVDRKSATGPIFVAQAAVCVAGGIQPGILHRSLGMEHRESGLAARLLLTYPPRRPKQWTEAEIGEVVQRSYEQKIEELYALAAGVDAQGREEPAAVRLSEDAKELFKQFCNVHGKEGVEYLGDLAAAWSKLEAYAARLALVLHCVADGEALEMRAETMAAALRLIDWLKDETRRIYAILGEDDSNRTLRQLAEWIDRKGGIVTAREVQQGRREYRTAESAEAALQALVDAGFGKWQLDVHHGGPGRPVRRFTRATTSESNRLPEFSADREDSVDVDSGNAA